MQGQLNKVEAPTDLGRSNQHLTPGRSQAVPDEILLN